MELEDNDGTMFSLDNGGPESSSRSLINTAAAVFAGFADAMFVAREGLLYLVCATTLSLLSSMCAGGTREVHCGHATLEEALPKRTFQKDLLALFLIFILLAS